MAVADRTMLILEIFGARAQSHEGKLQVELARLQYLSTRLVRRWSHLERQRGGIGTRGGPGEAQIELDRRMIGERIKAREAAAREASSASAARSAARASATRPSASRWSATPTPASRRCSMRWSRRAATPPTSCSPRWTPPRASSTSKRPGALGVAVRHGGLHPRPAAQAGRGLRGHAAGGGRCRPAAARGRLPPARCSPSRWPRSQRVLAEIGAARMSRRCWSSTSSTGSKPRQRPRVLRDVLELEGGVRCRAFSSAPHGTGLDVLRELLVAGGWPTP